MNNHFSNQDRTIHQFLSGQGVELDKEIASQFTLLIDRLLSENQKINLTAIQNEQDILIRHILDSLMPIKYSWEIPGYRGCDVGTGAGFPGLIYAILRPDFEWTLIESVRKKIKWLEKISLELNLNRINLISKRAELLGIDPEFRENFDICLSRAVAAPSVMLEYCLPLVRLGGELWAWQGENFIASDWEIPLNLLGGEILEVQSYILPEDPSSRKRILVRVQKIKTTPEKYPRRVGIPPKRPLI